MARHVSRRVPFFSRAPKGKALVAVVVAATLMVTGTITAFGLSDVVKPTPLTAEQLPGLPQAAAKVHPGAALTAKDATGTDTSDIPVTPKPAIVFSKTAPAAFNAATATVLSRSTFSTTYKGTAGTDEEKSSPVPLNVKNSSGDWVPVVTTLAQGPDGGFSDADQPLSPTFAPSTGGSSDYSVTAGGNTVSFDLLGAAAVGASTPTTADLGSTAADAGSAVAYPDVQPGTDLVYQVTNSGVAEALVLSAAPTSANPSWTWDIHAPGLTLSTDQFGDIVYTDGNGVVQMVTPQPVMSDSSGVSGQSQSASANVPYTLSQLADGDWSFTLIPDPTWLASSDRVYPVYVDPSTDDSGAENQNTYEGYLNRPGFHAAGLLAASPVDGPIF